MAKLDAKERKALPGKDFAGPNRSFPIPDKSHAKAALREINHASPGARANIRSKAEKRLHGDGGGKHTTISGGGAKVGHHVMVDRRTHRNGKMDD